MWMRSLFLSRLTPKSEPMNIFSHIFIDKFSPRPFLEKLAEISHQRKLHLKLGKPSRKQPLQFISTDTWDISDGLDEYSSIADLLEGSITIVEDWSSETENKLREHLRNIVNDSLGKRLIRNPFLPEIIPEWGRKLSRSYRKLSSFKIDTKVGSSTKISYQYLF